MKFEYRVEPFSRGTAMVDFTIESDLKVVIREMTEAELVKLVDVATSALEDVRAHRRRGAADEYWGR